jgi:hypothetical protein
MNTLITSGQKKSITRLLNDGVDGFVENLSIGKDSAQTFLSHGGEVQKVLQLKLNELIAQFSGNLIAEWTQFYREFLGLTVDLSGVKIPEHKNGFDRRIIVANELLTAKPYMFIVEAMKKHFPVWIYVDDLDKVIIKNDRWPDASYAVSFRDRVEADKELKNLSADDLAARNIRGITCLERLLYELKYFAETGKHLDIDNLTLCSGSRDSVGHVPSVFWRGDELCVSWFRSSSSGVGLRSRSAAVYSAAV